MLAAMLGAMSATDRPTACQTESVRRRPGPVGSTGASGRDDETAMRSSCREDGCAGQAAGVCSRREPDRKIRYDLFTKAGGTVLQHEERERRRARAEEMLEGLRESG